MAVANRADKDRIRGMLHAEAAVQSMPMLKLPAALAAALILTPIAVAQPRFVASDVRGGNAVRTGRVMISNDRSSITAWKFDGNIRQALMSIQSAPVRAGRADAALFTREARAAVPPRFSAIVQEASRAHGVDARLIAAVVGQESAWNPAAVSPVGARGLMQLMPATGRYLGVRDFFNPRENIFAGTRYLRTLLDTFDGDLELVLAAYNAGPGAVATHRGIPPYRETRNYVAKVKSSYERARSNPGA